jgi:hypothetical protein
MLPWCSTRTTPDTRSPGPVIYHRTVGLVGAVRFACRVMAVVFLASAAAVALVRLPPPAGGTCGPGTSSESAIAAFINPGSIGAGPKPAAGSSALPQWQAFVSACQSATDTRIVVAGGVFLAALLVGLGFPAMVRRFALEDDIDHVPLPPPGWYPDPTDPRAVRWWDGQAWGPGYGAPPSVQPPLPGAGPAG